MFAVDAVNSGGASGSGGAQTMEGAPGSGGVVSGCGNAALETDEGCDDGNQADGDGCSHDCKVEDGFICDTVAASQTCQPGTGQCLRLPVIYRDFQPENATSGGHPDFHFLGSKSNGTSYSYTHLHSQPIPLTRHTRRCLSEV
jgi:cysteine-rich repeat protein